MADDEEKGMVDGERRKSVTRESGWVTHKEKERRVTKESRWVTSIRRRNGG